MGDLKLSHREGEEAKLDIELLEDQIGEGILYMGRGSDR